MKTMIVFAIMMISIQVQAQAVKCPGTDCPAGSANAGSLGEIVSGVSGSATIDSGCAARTFETDRTIEGQENNLPDLKDVETLDI